MIPVLWLTAKTSSLAVLAQQERSIGKLFKVPVSKQRTLIKNLLRDRKAQYMVAPESDDTVDIKNSRAELYRGGK
jgi:hypothetical protein